MQYEKCRSLSSTRTLRTVQMRPCFSVNLDVCCRYVQRGFHTVHKVWNLESYIESPGTKKVIIEGGDKRELL